MPGLLQEAPRVGSGEEEKPIEEAQQMTGLEKVKIVSRGSGMAGAALTIWFLGRVEWALNERDKFWGNLNFNLIIRHTVAAFGLNFWSSGFLGGLLLGIGLGSQAVFYEMRKR
jgi:hypothetical protein